MNNKTSHSNLGVVVSVRGSVVDTRFDEHLPPIYSVLRTGDEGRIVIEVLAQLDGHHVRGIALTPTQGLARGTPVEDTGGPLKVPVGRGILSRRTADRNNSFVSIRTRHRGAEAGRPSLMDTTPAATSSNASGNGSARLIKRWQVFS